MDGQYSNLGEKVVQAAKLAAAIHLRELFLRRASREKVDAVVSDLQAEPVDTDTPKSVLGEQ